MTRVEVWDGARLRQQWDDTTRQYTAWEPDGTVKETREYSPAENLEADARAAVASSEATTVADLLSRARTALEANTAFLAVTSPTTAQAVAQVRALTRQVNALIRITTRALDSTSDT